MNLNITKELLNYYAWDCLLKVRTSIGKWNLNEIIGSYLHTKYTYHIPCIRRYILLFNY